jgi:uncharacterized protein YcfL
MRYVFILSLLLLVGCSNQPFMLRSTQNVLVTPEEGMYNCEIVDTFPDTTTLTDTQVARFIVTLYQNNVQCRNSIDAIRTFLENARATINTPPQENQTQR